MQEENLLKMAKMATPPIMDSHMANILLCYLLYRIDRPVQVSQLYDIAVGTFGWKTASPSWRARRI